MTPGEFSTELTYSRKWKPGFLLSLLFTKKLWSRQSLVWHLYVKNEIIITKVRKLAKCFVENCR